MCMQCCVLTVETPGSVGNSPAITEGCHSHNHPALTTVKQWQLIRICSCIEKGHRAAINVYVGSSGGEGPRSIGCVSSHHT